MCISTLKNCTISSHGIRICHYREENVMALEIRIFDKTSSPLCFESLYFFLLYFKVASDEYESSNKLALKYTIIFYKKQIKCSEPPNWLYEMHQFLQNNTKYISTDLDENF